MEKKIDATPPDKSLSTEFVNEKQLRVPIVKRSLLTWLRRKLRGNGSVDSNAAAVAAKPE